MNRRKNKKRHVFVIYAHRLSVVLLGGILVQRRQQLPELVGLIPLVDDLKQTSKNTSEPLRTQEGEKILGGGSDYKYLKKRESVS